MKKYSYEIIASSVSYLGHLLVDIYSLAKEKKKSENGSQIAVEDFYTQRVAT